MKFYAAETKDLNTVTERLVNVLTKEMYLVL